MQSSSLVPPIRVGIRARAKASFPFRLPRGLAEGTLLTVEQMDDGICTVRDRQGRMWNVAAVCLDPGHLVWHDGQWVPEEPA